MKSFAWTRLRHAASALALLALCTCAGIDNIDVATDGKATIAKATLIDKLLAGVSFAGFDKIDFSGEFANQGVTKDQVDSVHLKAMTLTITAPADGSFDFLKSVSFFAQAEGLPKLKIASVDAVPTGKKELDLTVDTSAELKPYVIAPSMQISGEVQGQRPDVDTTVAAHVVLDVDVHVPGCN